MEDKDYYEARLDKIFTNGAMWKHRTFRTVLDPFSDEWHDTTMDKKVEILEKVIQNGEKLEILISDYKQRYLEQNRKDIANSVETALIYLLEYKLGKDQ